MTNIIVRFIWWLFIGSWLTPIWYIFGFIFTALVITAPIGFWFFERIGYVFSFYEDESRERLTFSKAILSYLWFLFIGSWLGFVVMALAEACMVTIIGFPLGWWLMNRLDKVVLLV